MCNVEALIARARKAQREHSPDEWIIEELADALEGLVSAPMEATFTAEEVIGIANDTSDLQGNLYRLDFISRIEHEAGFRLPVVPVSERKLK